MILRETQGVETGYTDEVTGSDDIKALFYVAFRQHEAN